jgi:mannose-6-phosphate isomerase-like protein (cupin superfamily)
VRHQTITTRTESALLALLSVTFLQTSLEAQTNAPLAHPCVMELQDSTTHYQPILTGPPQTNGMESGFVVINPGMSGSQHSSKGYEEAIIVFSGSVEMRISGGPSVKLKSNSVAYCPTQTIHSIHNTGTIPLKYVYVAAKVIK